MSTAAEPDAATPELNNSHFIPRALMRGWEIPAEPGRAWTFRSKVIRKMSLKDVNTEPGPKEWNDRWNREVEQPALGAVRSVRCLPKPAAFSNAAMRLTGLKARTEAALFHLIFSFPTRNPDTPKAWNIPTQENYLALLGNPRLSSQLITEIKARWALFAVWRSASATPLALPDWAVFTLEPAFDLPILFMPVTPDIGIAVAAKQLTATVLENRLKPFDLGALSEGAPSVVRLLHPDADWNEPRLQNAANERIHANILKWRPVIIQWGSSAPAD